MKRLFWLFIALSIEFSHGSSNVFYLNIEGNWETFQALPVTDVNPSKTASFNITYEDVLAGTGIGFDDPMVGPIHRQTLMAVLGYIGEIIQNDGIADVLVERSEFDGTGAPASGSPLFPSMDGVFGGYAFDHLTTGVDPCSVQNCGQDLPDMVIKVDFGYRFYSGPNPPPPDRFDLFSVLLKEVTQGLGMISLTAADGSSALETNTISIFDDHLHATHGQKLWHGTQFVGEVENLRGLKGGVQYIGYRTFRGLGHFPRVNTPPVFDPEASLSHWDPIIGQGAVLGPNLPTGVMKRSYLPFEIDALGDLGYAVDKARMGPRLDYQTTISAPSLYLTAIEVNDQWQTEVGLINRLDEDLRCILNAHTASGWLLAQSGITLAAGGQFKTSVDQVFGDLSPAIKWIRVQSERAITSYSIVKSVDGRQAYAVNGGRRLVSNGYIPHIAQDTNIWYTRIDVANARPTDTRSELTAGGDKLTLSSQSFYSEDSFDVLDRFGGQLPETSWAIARDLEGRGSLTGHEVFGRIDGVQQSAGLQILDQPSLLPGFRGRLYFPHIARDTAQFWTGFAYANITSQTQAFTLRAWGPGGALVGEKQISLLPSERVITLAEALLEGIGTPETVDWVEFEFEHGLIGLELFGTHDGRRLAGLEAVVTPKRDLIFPIVEVSTWQGIAITNTSETDSEVQFTLKNESGTLSQTEPMPLKAKEKAIFLVTDLFAEFSMGQAWILASSDQEIIGFELVGSHDGETMFGLLAH